MVSLVSWFARVSVCLPAGRRTCATRAAHAARERRRRAIIARRSTLARHVHACRIDRVAEVFAIADWLSG
jgi:hypothetical protein